MVIFGTLAPWRVNGVQTHRGGLPPVDAVGLPRRSQVDDRSEIRSVRFALRKTWDFVSRRLSLPQTSVRCASYCASAYHSASHDNTNAVFYTSDGGELLQVAF